MNNNNATFCWETLGPGIQVDVILSGTSNLNTGRTPEQCVGIHGTDQKSNPWRPNNAQDPKNPPPTSWCQTPQTPQKSCVYASISQNCQKCILRLLNVTKTWQFKGQVGTLTSVFLEPFLGGRGGPAMVFRWVVNVIVTSTSRASSFCNLSTTSKYHL